MMGTGLGNSAVQAGQVAGSQYAKAPKKSGGGGQPGMRPPGSRKANFLDGIGEEGMGGGALAEAAPEALMVAAV